ncbi:MAG: alpha/beta hydrolase [Burkholderiaceae bacterium]
MSADGIPAQALYFGTPKRPLFGWLHPAASPPDGTAPSHGVVLCAPFGYEAVCAHRSLRHLAQASAARGLPTLRFDYDGVGDSAGAELDEGRVDAWVESVRAAIESLRARTGVERVHLAGLRFGATLAALAADGREDVATLVAIAPVVRGRAYLRELRALQIASGRGDAEIAPDGVDTVREVLGMPIGPGTWQSMGEIDLVPMAGRAVREIMVLERPGMPGERRWLSALEAADVALTIRVADDYEGMMLDPQDTVVPRAMIDSVADWLAARSPAPASGDGKHAHAPAPACWHADIAELVEPRAVDGAPIAIREQPVRIAGDGPDRFAIVTEAAVATTTRPRGIVLLNAGAVHHVGPNRLHVTLARRWAAQGHVVVRLDIGGIGDSPTPLAAIENTVYPEHAVADVASVCAWLRTRRDVGAVHALGLCSGAYHAFKAAVAAVGVDAVVAVNPLTFFWHVGDAPGVEHHDVRGLPGVRHAPGVSPAPTKLRGEIALLRRIVGAITSGREPLAQARGRRASSRCQHQARIADDLAMETSAASGVPGDRSTLHLPPPPIRARGLRAEGGATPLHSACSVPGASACTADHGEKEADHTFTRASVRAQSAPVRRAHRSHHPGEIRIRPRRESHAHHARARRLRP